MHSLKGAPKTGIIFHRNPIIVGTCKTGISKAETHNTGVLNLESKTDMKKQRRNFMIPSEEKSFKKP